jgi:hypothetical protein
MDPKQEKRSLLEENLVKVLSAIDTQIAREMQRTPAQREEHGVQKWEPYQKRVELIVSRVLNSLGDQEVTLDGVLVFAQAMSKTLLLAVEDLGADGLGKIRSSYCEAAMQNIAQDVSRGLQMLRQGGELN